MAVDMPLEQLKQYKGISPRPKDFDEYWKRAKEELNGTDPEVELKPASFVSNNSECFDLYFTGVRNARIYAKYARPKNYSGKLPAILLFHGYRSKGGDYSWLMRWTNEGYAVLEFDCRGQAGKSEDTGGVQGNTSDGHIIRGLEDETPDNMLFRHIFLDTVQLAKIVAGFPEVDETKIYTHGMSQGGALALACAALSPYVTMSAAISPFLSDFRRVYEKDLGSRSYAELKQYFRDFDPLHEREDEIFERLGYIDIANLAPYIKAEIKMFTGLQDMTCPPSAQFAIYNRLTCKKDIVVYPDFGHEGFPYAYDMIMKFFNKGSEE